MATRIIGNKEKGMDILHTIIVKMYDNKTAVESIDDIDAYVARCVMIISRQTSRSHTVELDIDDEFAAYIPPKEPDVWELIELTGCSWWEKEVFRRKALEDKTYEELSDDCGVSVPKLIYSCSKVRKRCIEIWNKIYNDDEKSEYKKERKKRNDRGYQRDSYGGQPAKHNPNR